MLLDFVANALEFESQTNIFMCWLSLSFFLLFALFLQSRSLFGWLEHENVVLFVYCYPQSRSHVSHIATSSVIFSLSLPAFIHLAKALHDITY